MGRMSWLVGLAFWVSACASELPPEGSCRTLGAGDPACSSVTPLCFSSPDGSQRCTASCTSSSDCNHGGRFTSCDVREQICTTPCLSDEIRRLACVDGEREYCDSDASLPCTACPQLCDGIEYCDPRSMACAPRRAVGATCSNGNECASFNCVGGVCGVRQVRQGEACTPETCSGACAMTAAGTAFCVQSDAPSDCNTRMDLGLQWRAITYRRPTGNTEQCFPIESCTWRAGCGTFVGGRCGQSCSSSGSCFTFCVPSELYPAD